MHHIFSCFRNIYDIFFYNNAGIFIFDAAMSGLSSYAVRMARLSAQIFGEVVNPVDSRSLKVVQLFQDLPMAKRKEVYEWYPQHKIYYAMTQRLRFMGLFRCVSLLSLSLILSLSPCFPPTPLSEMSLRLS